MKMRSVTPMRVAKTGYIIMSVVFCVLVIVFLSFRERLLNYSF